MSENETVRSENTKGSSSLLKVLEFTTDKTLELADANSVLGEKIEIDGMTIIPISKLSVGFAGGGADVTDVAKKKKQNPAGGGAHVTLTPMSFLVVKDGDVRVLNIQAESSGVTPDLLKSVFSQAKDLFRKK